MECNTAIDSLFNSVWRLWNRRAKKTNHSFNCASLVFRLNIFDMNKAHTNKTNKQKTNHSKPNKRRKIFFYRDDAFEQAPVMWPRWRHLQVFSGCLRLDSTVVEACRSFLPEFQLFCFILFIMNRIFGSSKPKAPPPNLTDCIGGVSTT